MQNPIIVALDVPTAEQALKLAREVAPAVGAFKIGSELFTAAGPDIVVRAAVFEHSASLCLDAVFNVLSDRLKLDMDQYRKRHANLE